MPQSTAPAAIAALHTMWTAVLPADFALTIGPPPGGDLPADYACVAWAGDNLPSVTGTSRPPELGNPGQVASEEYAIWNAVSTSSGDELGPDRLSATDALFQPMVAAVRANRHLSGVLTPPGIADLGTFQWQIEEGGQIATVYFQVIVDAGWVGL